MIHLGSLESTKEARAVQGRSRDLSVLESEFSFCFIVLLTQADLMRKLSKILMSLVTPRVRACISMCTKAVAMPKIHFETE